MPKIHQVRDIVDGPVFYLISKGEPWIISDDDIIEGVPLPELITRLEPSEHLFFVDFAHSSGRIRLTRLV